MISVLSASSWPCSASQYDLCNVVGPFVVQRHDTAYTSGTKDLQYATLAHQPTPCSIATCCNRYRMRWSYNGYVCLWGVLGNLRASMSMLAKVYNNMLKHSSIHQFSWIVTRSVREWMNCRGLLHSRSQVHRMLATFMARAFYVCSPGLSTRSSTCCH